MKKKLLTISDGNGVNLTSPINGLAINVYKRWPSLLQILCSKTITVVNKSIIGASNELMMLQLAEAVANEKIDAAIIQWSIPNRLDVVADDFWRIQAQEDSVYAFNIVKSNNKDWWVSSASKNEFVQAYHNRYIHKWQSAQRSQAYMLAAAKLLENQNIPFVFTLAYNFDFVGPLANNVLELPWAWHDFSQGLSEFRHISEFSSHDKKHPQPHSLIQLDWIDKILKPAMDIIDYDQKVYYTIKNHLLKNNV